MPVARMHMGKGPPNSPESKTIRYSWVFIDVLMIIVVNEVVLEGLAEDSPDYAHKEKADNNRANPIFMSTGLRPGR